VDLALDSQNNLYAISATSSETFPIKSGEYKQNNGEIDLALMKFTSTGSLTWSTYFGGSQDDMKISGAFTSQSKPSITIDLNDNVIICSETRSEDFPLKNSQFNRLDIEIDVVLSMFSPSGKLLWSTFAGNSEGWSVAIDRNNNILLAGIGGSNFRLMNAFEYNFEEAGHGSTSPEYLEIAFVAKWDNNGTIAWNTPAPIIVFPQADYDNDTLSNFDEYQLCFSSSFAICTDPRNADTDGDKLNDGVEVARGLNPVVRDTDGDGLVDGYEDDYGTDPLNMDSDGDNLPDGFEVFNALDALEADSYYDFDGDGLTNLQEYQYNPELDPWDPDTDDDGMPDGWEVANKLDPTIDDSNHDTDNDGMTNLEEYGYIDRTFLRTGLNASNPDTDGDGLPDGWEVDNGLSPVDASGDNGPNGDKDGDFINNKLEHQLDGFGFRADSKLDAIILTIFVLVLVGLGVLYALRLRKLRANAKLMGYETYPEYKRSMKAGFASAKEHAGSISRGFLTARIRDMIGLLGYTNVDGLIGNWRDNNNRVRDDNELKSEKIIQSIDQATSPSNLLEKKQDLDAVLNKLDQELEIFTQQITLQKLIIEQYTLEKTSLLQGITLEQLNQFSQQSQQVITELETHRSKLNSAYDQKVKWFSPWKSLLSLIQITEDGMPIELTRIAEVVSCTEKQAEKLLGLLLLENSLIGSYDKEKRVYTKGVNIKEYLEMIISQIADGINYNSAE
jgi:hypothetical protein